MARGGFGGQSNLKHGIRIPGKILDEIRKVDNEGKSEEDTRFAGMSKKRKEHPVSRKERRKQERDMKKRKKGSDVKKPVRSKPDAITKPLRNKTKEKMLDDLEVRDELDSGDDLSDEEQVMALLKTKKGTRKMLEFQSSTGGTQGIRVMKEEDLDDDFDDDFDDELGSEGFSEAEEAGSQSGDDSKSGDEDDDEEFEGFGSDDYEEDPLEKLRALKAKNKESQLKPDKTTSEKHSAKHNREGRKDKHSKSSALVSPAAMSKDNEDIMYYAKKLGLKGNNAQLKKRDEFDDVGGLLDGLNFDFSDGNDDDSDERSEEDDDDNAQSRDSEDFDEDELRELQEMEELESGSDEDVSDYSGLDDDSDSSSRPKTKRKENPYVAPGLGSDNAGEMDALVESKYIPPAIRRKMALESNSESAELINLKKSIKSSLNKLSEANVGKIVDNINSLYLSNPRHLVSENLTSLILESVEQQARLLDTFVFLQATVACAIFRLQGTEFGALFIQSLVERFESYQANEEKNKELTNIISLLSAIYTFQLTSSKLLYDIVRNLIKDLNESNAELLLKLIQSSGNQMRLDDPTALKEIVLSINQATLDVPEKSLSPRFQFLLETISSLKSNKMKLNNNASHQLIQRMRKFLSAVNNKFSEPIQVSLEDIQNVPIKGKWWLVGSAWKGSDPGAEQENTNTEAISDILDSSEANWLELAKSQRMNTDIRRAIFVSIMSANDYVDALTSFDKLPLKKSQEREIARVLVHCSTMEPAWNPYYGILAAKLCDSHSNRKAFQFLLWDLLKEYEGTDEADEDINFSSDDDDTKLKKLFNLGRLYGFLFSEGSLPLHIMRVINFWASTEDTLFLTEVILVTFLDRIAKISQTKSPGASINSSKNASLMSETKYDDKKLVEILIKCKEQPTLLKGLDMFLEKRVMNSDLVSGKRQRQRVEWGIKSCHDIIDEFLQYSNSMIEDF